VSGGLSPAFSNTSRRYTMSVLSATKGSANTSLPLFMGAMAPERKSVASVAESRAMKSLRRLAQPAPIHFPEKMKVRAMTS
jgi:hypothetical protein